MDWSKLRVIVLPEYPANTEYTLRLVQNLRKIASFYGIRLHSIKRKGSVVAIDSSDPVRLVHETAENAFGVDTVYLSMEVPSTFSKIQSAVNHIGKKYLQKNEKFCIRAIMDLFFEHKKNTSHSDDDTSFKPADIELACNSSLIDALSDKGIKPAPEQKSDKLFYVHVTSDYAYVSLFHKQGNGGCPQDSKDSDMLCCIHDVFSALSCLQAVRMGFTVKIILCHSEYEDLVALSKITAKISRRLLQKKTPIYLCRIDPSRLQTRKNKQLLKVLAISEICSRIAKKNRTSRVSLGLSPQSIHPETIEQAVVFPLHRKGIIHWAPLCIEDKELLNVFKRMELESHLDKLYQERNDQQLTYKKTLPKTATTLLGGKELRSIVNNSAKDQKTVYLQVDNPNVIHDVINAGLRQEHNDENSHDSSQRPGQSSRFSSKPKLKEA